MMAPEVIDKQPVCVTADWWSFGCLLFEMLTGVSPFYNANDTNVIQLLGRIRLCEFTFPEVFSFSNAIVDLTRSLLTQDPSLRLGAAPLGQSAVAGHPWFGDMPSNQPTVPAAPHAGPQQAGGNGQQVEGAQELQPGLSYAFVDAHMPAGQELMASLLALSQPVVLSAG